MCQWREHAKNTLSFLARDAAMASCPANLESGRRRQRGSALTQDKTRTTQPRSRLVCSPCGERSGWETKRKQQHKTRHLVWYFIFAVCLFSVLLQIVQSSEHANCTRRMALAISPLSEGALLLGSGKLCAYHEHHSETGTRLEGRAGETGRCTL